MTESSKPLVTCDHSEGISLITLDDGKANVMSPPMISEINSALDKAESNGGVVILTGREKMFSGGFDLSIFKAGDREEIYTMLTAGAQLAQRLLSFPLPTITACSGHAIAMGTFVLLATDYRIGIRGDSKFAANEVAIGLTVPHFAIETLRQRLSPAALNKAVNLAWYFASDEALTAGFLDELADADTLLDTAKARATAAQKLDAKSHTNSKLRLRADLLTTIENAIARDCENWRQSYA